jgi:hypothetical protein
MSPMVESVSDNLKKYITSLQEVIKAYDFPPGTPPKIDLATDLYPGSALSADYDEMSSSNSSDLFRSLST